MAYEYYLNLVEHGSIDGSDESDEEDDKDKKDGDKGLDGFDSDGNPKPKTKK